MAVAVFWYFCMKCINWHYTCMPEGSLMSFVIKNTNSLVLGAACLVKKVSSKSFFEFIWGTFYKTIEHVSYMNW